MTCQLTLTFAPQKGSECHLRHKVSELDRFYVEVWPHFLFLEFPSLPYPDHKMDTARRNRLMTDYVRSPFISERRRKLFPAEDQDVDSELGHISPIHSDDENERRKIMPLSNKSRSELVSSLELSPYTGEGKLSPSQSLKTPHDTSTKPVLKKEQKILLEESKSLKRKAVSPEHKNCKVRTALFPPESVMKLTTKRLNASKEKPTFRPARRNCTSGKKRGQINNGVWHKIRKPKQKKVVKNGVTKATKRMLDTGSALTEYICDLSELKQKQIVSQKLIVKGPTKEHQPNRIQICSPPKQIQASKEENKENVDSSASVRLSSPEEKKVRKFFKSPRAKPVFHKSVPKRSEKKENTHVILDGLEDFDEDDSTPVLPNIDNILSSLSTESPTKKLGIFAVESNNGQIVGDVALESLRYTPDFSNIPLMQQSSQVVFHQNLTAFENQGQQLHRTSDIANMILSPISQMCDVTSGLALNSPGRGRDITLGPRNGSRASKMLSFNGDCNPVDMEEQRRKLFPIFSKGAASGIERGEKRERGDVQKRSVKRFKALASDQMLMDAGQKKFGLTLCNECNIIYHMGDPNDEIQHSNYHNGHHVLRFGGWKNEHIVAEFHSNGRIIRVLPTDAKIWLKKVTDLMGIVIRDLGCYEMDYDISQSQVYIYVKNRTITGCAVATIPKGPGHRMLSSVNGVAMCSEESYPIKCGISHIWVATNFRKQGIACALVDAIKNNFSFGTILTNDEVALTSPTEAGSAFAEKYFKTPNYLIYYV